VCAGIQSTGGARGGDSEIMNVTDCNVTSLLPAVLRRRLQCDSGNMLPSCKWQCRDPDNNKCTASVYCNFTIGKLALSNAIEYEDVLRNGNDKQQTTKPCVKIRRIRGCCHNVIVTVFFVIGNYLLLRMLFSAQRCNRLKTVVVTISKRDKTPIIFEWRGSSGKDGMCVAATPTTFEAYAKQSPIFGEIARRKI
jgi:hypothetical protein